MWKNSVGQDMIAGVELGGMGKVLRQGLNLT